MSQSKGRWKIRWFVQLPVWAAGLWLAACGFCLPQKWSFASICMRLHVYTCGIMHLYAFWCIYEWMCAGSLFLDNLRSCFCRAKEKTTSREHTPDPGRSDRSSASQSEYLYQLTMTMTNIAVYWITLVLWPAIIMSPVICGIFSQLGFALKVTGWNSLSVLLGSHSLVASAN